MDPTFVNDDEKFSKQFDVNFGIWLMNLMEDIFPVPNYICENLSLYH
jgi:hypothetical protein